MILHIENLHKSYKRNKQPVLQGINLSLENGQVAAIVGKSGSGKSTILKAIAGLETIDSGRIALHGKDISSSNTFISPEKRNIGYLFQDFALFPHLTVAKNIAFGLPRRTNKQKRILELLTLMGLEIHHSKYPHELSGGEQQRVALARALAPNPSLLLLDEPFSSLDNHIRKEVRSFVFSIIRSTGLSCIFVTHDLEDVMEYADTISILHDGAIEQTGSPEEVYRQPASPHVAGFFGQVNILDREMIECFRLAVPAGKICGVRTCDVRCSLHQGKHSRRARVVKRTSIGRYSRLEVEILNGCRLDLELSQDSNYDSEEIYISIHDKDVLHFDDR